MKKQIFFAAIVLCALFGGSTANAQVSVRFNIGVQPVWGPSGYDYAQYYYIPDIDAYYDVTAQNYVYNDGGRWVTSVSLPSRYGNVDIYRVHKVVINSPSPWNHNDRYRSQYSRYRGRHDQVVIRDARDEKYWQNPNHPMHSRWNEHGHDRGRGGDNRHDDRGRGNDHRNDRGNDHRNDRPNDRGNDHRNERPNDRGNDHRNDRGNDHGNDHRNDRGNDKGNDHGNDRDHGKK